MEQGVLSTYASNELIDILSRTADTSFDRSTYAPGGLLRETIRGAKAEAGTKAGIKADIHKLRKAQAEEIADLKAKPLQKAETQDERWAEIDAAKLRIEKETQRRVDADPVKHDEHMA